MTDSNKGGKKEVKGSVNKIGPVVKKNSLVTGPNFNPPKQTKAIGKAPIVKPVHRKTDPTSSKIPIPSLPSSMRKQNQMMSSLKNRTPSKSTGRSTSSGKGEEKQSVSINTSSSSSIEVNEYAKPNPVANNAILTEPFTEEEVKEIIWSSDGNKSPGPDGFNFNFLKTCWSIVKSDVMNFVEEFFVNAVLPKAITSSFLTLIPKKDHPESLSDYRPIFLIGCLYKILSKLLTNRLKRVLGKLISPCQ
ncbi:unnamed protein product [Trifolium pratense]|uniref:Uncharacterized protein n=1 Tax=Trifolium pratense TaxID=57577 RepID=A0ACB0J0P7_TRIPR|nr:unnamed protein product [Trifolium pratense]